MRFDVIYDPSGLETYGDVPYLPDNMPNKGIRFKGKASDADLLASDLVPGLDTVCDNNLSYGDVEYFDTEQCKDIEQWLMHRMQHDMTPRLRELYQVLLTYLRSAIVHGTGVVIEL